MIPNIDETKRHFEISKEGSTTWKLPLVNKRQRKTKVQSRMDNPEKLSTLGTQDEDKPNKTQRNMWWTLLYVNKHK